MRRTFQIGRLALLCAALAAASPSAPGQTGTTSYVNFSFDQADLRLLVKLVGDMTGRRFVIDNTIGGKVTVVTPPRIPLDEVYPLFLSILESSGYSVVENNGVYTVVPLAEKTPAAPLVTGESGADRQGIITKVILVQNISATELKKVLEPMVRGGKGGALAAFGPTNHLIVTDTADSIRRIEQIIAELDRPGASRVVEILKLQHAAAEDIAEQLTAAMKGALSADKAVSRHIQQVAEGSGALPSDVVVVAAPAANALVVVGTPPQLTEMKRIVAMMDVERQTGYGRLNAVFLKYLSAEEAAKSLNGLLAKTVEKDQRQRIAIEPNAANNALLVDASPGDFALVKTLVDQLDKAPQQVMVEILIAEIELGKNLDLGVEWSTIDAPKDGTTTMIGRSRPGETDLMKDIVDNNTFPQGVALGVARGTYTDASGNVIPRIPFLIRALAENRDIKILSNVPLWAQNNTEASVSVVENIPILKSTIEGGAGTARDVIQNIDRTDVGIKLKFTPHVNPDGEVTMQLHPSIEAVTDEGSTETQFTPTIAKREVSTTVTVPNQTTVVISGLIREDQTKVVYKVPILGDIPLLGMLFRSTSDKKERTNLLIFVTPTIVTDMKAATEMKSKLQDQSNLNVSSTNLTVRSTDRKK